MSGKLKPLNEKLGLLELTWVTVMDPVPLFTIEIGSVLLVPAFTVPNERLPGDQLNEPAFGDGVGVGVAVGVGAGLELADPPAQPHTAKTSAVAHSSSIKRRREFTIPPAAYQ